MTLQHHEADYGATAGVVEANAILVVAATAAATKFCVRGVLIFFGRCRRRCCCGGCCYRGRVCDVTTSTRESF